MGRRPVLIRKIQRHKSGKRLRIGVLGAHSGAGVTYTAVLLAFVLGEQLGRRIALFEHNKNGDFKFLYEAFEWLQREENGFGYGMITFYPSVNKHYLTGQSGKNTDFIIFDFGSDYEQAEEEFLCCDVKLIVAGHADWCTGKSLSFIRSIGQISGSEDWILLIPCIDSKVRTRLSRIYRRPVYTLPFEADVTRASKETLKQIKQLIG